MKKKVFNDVSVLLSKNMFFYGGREMQNFVESKNNN